MVAHTLLPDSRRKTSPGEPLSTSPWRREEQERNSLFNLAESNLPWNEREEIKSPRFTHAFFFLPRTFGRSRRGWRHLCAIFFPALSFVCSSDSNVWPISYVERNVLEDGLHEVDHAQAWGTFHRRNSRVGHQRRMDCETRPVQRHSSGQVPHSQILVGLRLKARRYSRFSARAEGNKAFNITKREGLFSKGGCCNLQESGLVVSGHRTSLVCRTARIYAIKKNRNEKFPSV